MGNVLSDSFTFSVTVTFIGLRLTVAFSETITLPENLQVRNT